MAFLQRRRAVARRRPSSAATPPKTARWRICGRRPASGGAQLSDPGARRRRDRPGHARAADGTLVFVEVRRARHRLHGGAGGQHRRHQAAPHHLRGAALPDAPARAAAVPLRRGAGRCKPAQSNGCKAAFDAYCWRFRQARRHLSSRRHARATHPTAFHRQRRPQVPGRADAEQADRAAVRAVLACVTSGGKVLACGNGGSAAGPAFFRGVRRPLRARAARAGRHRADHRQLHPAGRHGRRPRLRRASRARCARWARPATCCWRSRQRQLGQRAGGHRGGARARDDAWWRCTGGAAAARRGRPRPARNRCPYLRAARAHGAHPGSPHARAALHLRRRGRPVTRRTGSIRHEAISPPRIRRLPSPPSPALAWPHLAGCVPLMVGGAAVVGTHGGDRPPQLGRAAGRRRHRAARRQPHARHRRRPRARQRDQLQPPGAADRRGAQRGDKQRSSKRSAARRERARRGQRAGGDGADASLVQRSNDTLVTGKVKASLVDAKDLFANAFKVVTERGTVYLMGRVDAARSRPRDRDHARRPRRAARGARLRDHQRRRTAPVRRAGRASNPPRSARACRCPRWSRCRRHRAPCRASPLSFQRRYYSSRVIRLEVSQRRPPGALHVGIELVDQRRHRQRARRCARASSSTRPRSLRIQSTAKPKSNLPSIMVLPRLSICQLCAAPLPITSSTCVHVQARPSGRRRWPRPGPAPARRCDLVDHLGQLARAAGAQQRDGAREGHRPPA